MADTLSTGTVVLAILGGGGLATLAGALTRVGELRREDHARWIGERREAYLSLFRQVGAAVHSISMVTIALDHADQGGQAIDRKKEAADYMRAAEWESDLASLRLLADRRAVAAVEQLVAAVEEFTQPMFAFLTELPEAVADFREAGSAKELFALEREAVLQARRDLRAREPWWPRGRD